MSTAQHIAFVCPRFQSGAIAGGAETLLRYLAEAAVAAGRKVTFLTTCATNHFTWENEIPPGHRQEAGMTVHFFPVNSGRDLPLFHKVQEKISRRAEVSRDEESQWIRNSVHSRALEEHLSQHAGEYDAIVMGPYLFGVIVNAARICPAKTILVPCLHDEPFAYLSPIVQLFQNAGGFMFNSTPERNLANRLYSIAKIPTTVVGMGIPEFTADASAFAAKHNLSTPYLLYCGRREPMKGTPLLVDYIRTFRERNPVDLKLVLAGSGHVEIPPSMRNHILDAGFLSESEKRNAMAGALAFCHPSLYESFGIVIMEAWMAGSPVLVHAQSQVLQYHCQQSSGGLWFRHYPDFEEEILFLLANQAQRTSMIQAGRQYVLQEFAPSAIQQRMLTFLDSVKR